MAEKISPHKQNGPFGPVRPQVPPRETAAAAGAPYEQPTPIRTRHQTQRVHAREGERGHASVSKKGKGAAPHHHLRSLVSSPSTASAPPIRRPDDHYRNGRAEERIQGQDQETLYIGANRGLPCVDQQNIIWMHLIQVSILEIKSTSNVNKIDFDSYSERIVHDEQKRSQPQAKKWGARLQGASPSSQLSCQNLVLAPLPTVTEVEAWNRRRSRLPHGTCESLQGFESSVHSCQSHLSRSARPNFSRSRTPRPPKSFGLLTVGQLTRQWPPFASSLPFQRKDLQTLSICFLAHFAKGKTVK
ncbi:hypothetical protein U9M48_029607 [Paspalum notatum var. saurae]|uniref:Uncharacterized protein n=1 Tax=Paspalum notatum var. saurae TaxID=547442 RepID=A0AAQ3TZ88_PASNO